MARPWRFLSMLMPTRRLLNNAHYSQRRNIATKRNLLFPFLFFFFADADFGVRDDLAVSNVVSNVPVSFWLSSDEAVASSPFIIANQASGLFRNSQSIRNKSADATARVFYAGYQSAQNRRLARARSRTLLQSKFTFHYCRMARKASELFHRVFFLPMKCNRLMSFFQRKNKLSL